MFYSRALSVNDGGGEPLTKTGGAGMWDYLVRRWRVEAALWVCYWNALERKDQASIRYCADHSLLLSVFWLVILIGGLMAFGMVVQFLQGGCR